MVYLTKKRPRLSVSSKRRKRCNLSVSAVPLFFIPTGCPFDANTSELCYGSSRLPLLKIHGSRSAVSSAKLSQCLAPPDISLKAKVFAYYSASLRFKLRYILSHKFYSVKAFLKFLFTLPFSITAASIELIF